jgi:hypothetical protein
MLQRLKGVVLSSAVRLSALVLLFFVFLPSRPAEARRAELPRRVILTGLISLEYERRWTDAEPEPQSSLTESVELGVGGPLVDPRIAIFGVSGSFVNRTYQPGDVNYKISGFNLNLSLLNQVNSVRNPSYRWMLYMPRPIKLHYSRYAGDDYTYSNYGISIDRKSVV